MIALSKELVENDDIATKREAYYVSKNWEDARFTEQPESDTVMDDVEAYFSASTASSSASFRRKRAAMLPAA